jgi:hypothetical protein
MLARYVQFELTRRFTPMLLTDTPLSTADPVRHISWAAFSCR